MIDYQDALARFVVPESKEKTAAFFKKYWLDANRLRHNWEPFVTSIFGPPGGRPSPDREWTQAGFDVTRAVGGLTLTSAQHACIQDCARITRDSAFAVIEDFDPEHPPHNAGPQLRFEFPIEISWKEIMDGGYISVELFGMPHKNYMIIGNSGVWGIYAANDWKNPTDILVAQKNVGPMVRDCFKEFG